MTLQIADLARLGYLPYQHHDDVWTAPTTLELRANIFGVRVKGSGGSSRDAFGRYLVDEESWGDTPVSTLWKKGLDANARQIAGWGQVWPAVIVQGSPGTGDEYPGDLMARPIRDENFQADIRFRKMPVSTFENKPYPVGTPGLVVSAIDEQKQLPLFFPSAAGPSVLIAVNHAGDPALGTLVYDLKEETDPDTGQLVSVIDPKRIARLQSAWRVVIPDAVCPDLNLGDNQIPDPDVPGETFNLGFLAWQLDRTGQDLTPGMGLTIGRAAVMDTGTIAGPIPNVVAAAGSRYGGPLNVGLVVDKHGMGATQDGEAMNSLHIDVCAYFRPGHPFVPDPNAGTPPPPDPPSLQFDRDGPLAFEQELWSPESAKPYLTQVHLRFDTEQDHDFECGVRKGMWKWEAEEGSYVANTDSVALLPPGHFICNGLNSPGGGSGSKPPQPPPQPGPPNPPPPPPPPRQGGPYGPRRTYARPPDPSSVRFPVARKMEDRRRPFLATGMEQSFPAFLGRPQSLNAADFDLRTTSRQTPDLIQQADEETPVVGRIEAFGARGGVDVSGNGYGGTGRWSYTNPPGAFGRFLGGTATGGWFILPPEVDIADQDTDFEPQGLTRSKTYFGVVPGVFFAAGLPDFLQGHVQNGYRWGPTSDGSLLYERATDNSSGVSFAEMLRLTQSLRAGVRESNPKSTVDVNGSMALPTVTKIANYTAAEQDFLILGDATAGSITITLPRAMDVPGRVYVVKKIAPLAAANTVTVAPSGGDTIEDGATAVLRVQYESIMFQSDGSEWWII